MTTGDEAALLAEQVRYYRARAGEYDRVYAEREDLRELVDVVDELPVVGDVLELACGTGQWTRALADRARTVTALDASPEVLERARARTAAANARFAQADIFAWQPQRRYDTVFFAFWLSHVPASRFADFWSTLTGALAPRGKVVFIDEGPAEAVREEVAATVRQLDDGSRYRIVKIFHDPATLTTELAALGWTADIRLRGNFLVGVAEPATEAG
ncbi:class I SAM-dependent methyltransferase [Streptomyces sp. A7024]|uniref:Class I SAM-dependent methyltransferase n=1 Tax=Streptomyces coryli TaxID=1128680 RepID=A0A6G4UCY5_9ACTN|nr:class I SAM-dependent methyltransferase [Streptomyces coryli]NGN69197.1 class I SAM-dependent methyltransferase [Streptomyces coryli]